MNILVTGAKGMVGTALVNNLKNIRDGKNRTRNIEINEIYEYDLDSTEAELDEYCAKADFVFNLAGVNRPENPEDFMKGNFGLFWNLTGGANSQLFPTTDIIETFVYRTMTTQNNFATSSAVGLYQSIFGFVLVMFSNWVVKRLDPDYALF